MATTTRQDPAYAAVDAYFGVADSSSDLLLTKKGPHPPGGGSRRLGVGAGTTPSDHQHDARKNARGLAVHDRQRILQVGSKRRRRGDNDDDDASGSDHEVEEEEEEGRTTAIDKKSNAEDDSNTKGSASISRRLVSASVLAKEQAIDQLKQQKKKKLGKKERQRLAKESETKKLEEEVIHDTGANSAEGAQYEKGISTTGVDTTNNSSKGNKHKRRKKVRSRQKNIYKDQRDVKPAHLVPGHRNYRGRPLTAETRAKLHMPKIDPRSPFTGDGEWSAVGDWNDNAVPGNNNYDGSHADALDAKPLAVDQFETTISMTKKDDEETGASLVPRKDESTEKRSSKRKRKKLKSKKYKNLL